MFSGWPVEASQPRCRVPHSGARTLRPTRAARVAEPPFPSEPRLHRIRPTVVAGPMMPGSRSEEELLGRVQGSADLEGAVAW